MRLKKLFLLFRNKTLNRLVLNEKNEAHFSSLSLREISKESLLNQFASFKKEGVSKAVLVIPREEVLSQDIEAAQDGDVFKKQVYQKLEKSFPYSAEQLAYGVRLMDDSEGHIRGTLLATSNEKLMELISPVEQSGLFVEDVITTDESLLSYFLSHKPDVLERSLLLDVNDMHLECILIEKNKIIWAKVFQTKIPDLMKEIDLMTIGYGGYEKIYVCGKNDPLFDEALQSHFQIPVERWKSPVDVSNNPIPCSLYGAVSTTHRFVSLLPKERKIKKKAVERKKLILSVAVSFLACSVSLALFLFIHIKIMEAKLDYFQKQISKLGSEYDNLKNMNSVLTVADQTYVTNQNVLILFKELVTHLPPGIGLLKFNLSENSLSIQGEGQDNASIADTLTTMKNLKGILNTKLEYARRKNQSSGNSGVYEFSVTAERQHEN